MIERISTATGESTLSASVSRGPFTRGSSTELDSDDDVQHGTRVFGATVTQENIFNLKTLDNRPAQGNHVLDIGSVLHTRHL